MKNNRSFFDTFLPCLKCLLYFSAFYLTSVLVSSIIQAIAMALGKSVPASLVGITAYIIVVIGLALGHIPFKTTLLKEAKINKPRIRFVVDGALFGIGFFGAFQGIAFLISKLPFSWIESMLRMQNDVASNQLDGNIAFAILYLGIFAPICEEIVFRGLMLSSLKDYIPKWVGIIACALCFGVIHFSSPMAMIVTFILGIMLGWIFHSTSSLIPCILAHMLFNVSNFLLFIPKNIGFYILVIACIPLITYSVIDIVRRGSHENL